LDEIRYALCVLSKDANQGTGEVTIVKDWYGCQIN
jgi:hypothetical protein